MTYTCTLLTNEDKGKILAYLEEMSAKQVAKKWNVTLLQYDGLLPSIEKSKTLKIYSSLDDYQLSTITKKILFYKKQKINDVNHSRKLLMI